MQGNHQVKMTKPSCRPITLPENHRRAYSKGFEAQLERGHRQACRTAGALRVSLTICGYVAVRYEALTYELAELPTEGIIGSAILTFLVLDASRRISGWGFVAIILAIAVYVYISPFMGGDFQTRWVSPERMVAYVGLDVNGMIGNILQVAVLVVIPYTILGQVLARTGGADFFSDLAMSAMWRFRGGAAKIAVVGSALFGMISGAAVSNVLQFKKNFPTAKVITLVDNYRSTQTILDASYALIQNNNPNRLEVVEKIDKKLRTHTKALKKPIEIIHEQRAEDEADAIARKISELSKKYELKDFAVLVRANNHAHRMSRKKPAPNPIRGGYRFCEQGHAQTKCQGRMTIRRIVILQNHAH